MANTIIQIKKSLVGGNTPSSLANGEVAINSVDGKLFYSTPSGSIQFITNQQSFATIISNGSAILATSTSDTLVINPSNGINIQTNTTSKTITIDGSEILAYAQAAFNLANTETVLSGWTPNTVIVANSNGYISNSNASFFASNNTLFSNTFTATSFNHIDGTPVGYTYQLDDISSYFDGRKKTFPLTINNGTPVTPNNPNQLTIAIGNVPIFSTQRLYDYHNLPEISPFNSGFYASNNTISFVTPPIPGMSFYGTFKNNSDQMPSFSFKQTPFSALNIMLGP